MQEKLGKNYLIYIWKKLSDLYELYMNKKPIYELIQRLIKYKTLEELTKSLKNKLAKDGINKFRENIDYMKTITTIKNYLNKWNDKVKKLKKRENKLKKGLDEIEKRQLINDINTIADVELIKQVLHSIPVARAYDFFDKLKDLYDKKNEFYSIRKDIFTKIIISIEKYNETYLKNKLRQWLSNANKIRDNAAKNRIAQYIEDRYRISNARKNWKKLSDLYGLYKKKQPLLELRKSLIEYMTLKDLADNLRNRFTKTGIDQLKKGADYIIMIKYLRMLIYFMPSLNCLFPSFLILSLNLFVKSFIILYLINLCLNSYNGFLFIYNSYKSDNFFQFFLAFDILYLFSIY